MPSRFLTPFSGRGMLARDPFLDLHQEINRLFDDSFRTMREGGTGSSAMMLNPRVDVTQTPDGWEITAELPGVSQDDIDLRLDDNVLTISGVKRDEREDEKSRFVERSYGSFTRSFQLPFAPDPDKVTADCDRGVLTIKVPKEAEKDKSRRIAIRGGAGTRTIEASSSEEPVIGKDWKSSQDQARNEQSEKTGETQS